MNLLNSLSLGQEFSQKIGREEHNQIMTRISQLLVSNYFDKEVGKICAVFLKEKLEAGTYKNIKHPRALARQLTADLRKVHHDRHIRIQTVSADISQWEDANPLLAIFLHMHERIKENLGFWEVKILSGNVGYLNLRLFEPLDLVRGKALNALHFLENTDALIIDLRQNRGGNPATVQFLCSWFFDRPVLLNNTYWRRGDYTEEFWTIKNMGIKKRPEVPLFILIGSETFSGGEEFAYNLKVQKRATLIGQKTAGGANPGYTFTINDRFSIFIPTGHPVNPITGTNWEGVGVIPDIPVKPSDVLSLARAKATKAARIYREKSDDDVVESYMDLSAGLDKVFTLFSENRVDSAETLLASVLTEKVESDLIGEWIINSLGYRYLSQKNFSMAIALLTFNSRCYPESANAYDSLAEAYMKKGQREEAIKNYTISLSLDPQNQNARRTLEKLADHSDNE
jgi:tetratricopeptide (TPR) repeat protein